MKRTHRSLPAHLSKHYIEDENHEVIVTSKTTGNNGRLTYDGLVRGVYEIRETVPPAGYVVSEDIVFYLKVEAGTVTYVEKGTGKPSSWAPASGDGTTIRFFDAQAAVEDDLATPEDETSEAVNPTFRVVNTPGVELPHTGGRGTGMFTILGSLLIAGAGLLLFRRRMMI